MIKFLRAVLVALSLVAITVSAGAGSLNAPSRYECVDTVFTMPVGAWFGGFDILPNGNFAITDGYSIREIASSGADVQTLYSYSSMVYGSFVKYNPADGLLYFGESSYGTIKSVSLSGGAATDFAAVAFNYDMDFLNGVAYVSGGNRVYRIDDSTGAADPVAEVGMYSGPLAFDSAGNLIYSPGDDDWQTPRDQSVFSWTARQLASAGNGTLLRAADASVLAGNVSPYGFAVDDNGDLLFSEATYPAAIKILSGGSVAELTAPADLNYGITYLRYNAANGSLSAAVSWFDEYWTQHTVISTLVLVPEPCSALAFCSLIGLAGSTNLLRCRRK
ncbi:MAG: hypothetical protein A2Z18_00690 [Armatimonadetes bacterium RBG_16_58_9]|nr:MAG: hypothetical protein A2Z18_00690 [Armatimonadetes bacterium RBG_16_58_9]